MPHDDPCDNYDGAFDTQPATPSDPVAEARDDFDTAANDLWCLVVDAKLDSDPARMQFADKLAQIVTRMVADAAVLREASTQRKRRTSRK